MNKEDYFKYYIQGSDHYLIPKDVFKELFNEMVNWRKESKELKQKYVNAVADYETTRFEKEQLNSLVNSCQEEIRQLKKQLEDTNEELELVRCDLHNRTSERNGYYRNIEILENQQKEFIKYLENRIDICDGFLDTVKSDLQETPYGVISANEDITTRIKENETAHKVYEEIVQKYKEIIGDDK